MKRILPLLFLLLGGLGAISARAEVVSGLYEAQVPVSDKGQATRQQALLNAFRDVLVKVSGYGGVLDDPSVAEAVSQADRYVQQFRYSDGAAGGKPLNLWVRFNRAGVEQLLQSHDLPVWGSARPVLAVWLAVEENGARHLVGADDSTYAPALMAEAATRGIPMRLPLLDLTDRSNVSSSDVWGDFRSTILAASKRYDAQAVLTGRLYKGRSGGWRVRWALYGEGDPVRWDDSGVELWPLLASGIDTGVDTVSLRYTRAYGDSGEKALRLRVEDISGLQDFNRVRHYLEGVSGIAGVEVTEMGADYATFRLELSGPRGSAVQALSLGDVLDEVHSAGGMDAAPAMKGPELVYRLLK